MKERLLITGGTGFVAYHIIEEAIRQGFEVFASVRPGSSTVHLKQFDIQYTNINFADINAIVKELEEKQYQYIIHTAGTTKAPSEQQYNLVNATYTHNLAIAANTAKIQLEKFVFISSLAAVGPCNSSGPESLPSPVTAYGRSKLQAEKLLEEVKGLPLITLRPTAVYGPREKDIFIVFKTISRGWEPYIGRKTQHLSFVYVKDLARLIVNALHTNITGRAYNISDGNQYDRFALAAFTKSALRRKTVKVFLPSGVVGLVASVLGMYGKMTGKTPALNREKLNELTASWNCSIDAARADLNFEPAYDLEKGIQETMQWYKAEKWI
jgi:nucleoside-diphosphate-sugar epimerase